MSKRTLFVITTILSTVSLFGLIWLQLHLTNPTYLLLLYILWAVLFSVASLFVMKSNFVFPEHIIYSLLVMLYGVGELLLIIALYDGLFSLRLYLVLVISGIFKYVLFLTINIINAATVRTVPLLKAAKKTLLLISFFNAVIWAYFIITFIVQIELAAWIWALYSLLVGVCYLYLTQVQVVDEFRAARKVPLLEAGIIAAVNVFLVLMTSSWSVPLVVRLIYWALSLIVFMLIIQGKMTRTLSKRGLQELTILTWVLFLMLLLSGLR